MNKKFFEAVEITLIPGTVSKCQCGHSSCKKWEVDGLYYCSGYYEGDANAIAAFPKMLDTLIKVALATEHIYEKLPISEARKGEVIEAIEAALPQIKGGWAEIKKLYEECNSLADK